MKTLILYVFHEIKNEVKDFINKAIFEDDDYKFAIICNSKRIFKLDIIPNYVLYFERENVGFDFGGWSYGLLTNDLYKNFDRFIFVNSSVSGPYLPPYFKGKWPEVLLSGLTDDIKLYGPTINTWNEVGKFQENCAHVQSYVFVTDRIGLDILINTGIFSLTFNEENFHNTIVCREIRMSREIISAGYNIGCLMRYYDGIDFRKQSEYTNFIWHGDFIYQRPWYEYHLTPYEIVFIKTNRGINLKPFERFIKS